MTFSEFGRGETNLGTMILMEKLLKEDTVLVERKWVDKSNQIIEIGNLGITEPKTFVIISPFDLKFLVLVAT